MPNWLPVLSNLAALFTAIAALLTVLEMRRQRSSSYKPDICVTPVQFYVYRDKKRSRIPLSWSINPIDQPDGNDRLETVLLDCDNVGFGAAKDVEGRWNFELQEFITLLAEVDTEGSIKCFIEQNQVLTTEQNQVLTIEADDLKLHETHMIKNQMQNKLGNILNRSVRDRPARLRLPPSYLRLCSIYLYFFRSLGSREETRGVPLIVDIPVPPPLRLELCYRDIGNAHLTKTFEVKPNFFRVNADNDEGGWQEIASGVFVVEEKD